MTGVIALAFLVNVLFLSVCVIAQQLRLVSYDKSDLYPMGYVALNAIAAACGLYLTFN